MSSPVSKAGEARRWVLEKHWAGNVTAYAPPKISEGTVSYEELDGLLPHVPVRVREDKACEEDVEKAALAIFVVREDASTFEWGVLDEEERAPYLAEARAVVNVVFGGPDDNE